MVRNNSAQLFWPSEHRIPVGRNHTDMVKFFSSEDATYRTVVTRMTECVSNLATSRGIRWPLLGLSLDGTADEDLHSKQRKNCQP